MNWLVIGEVRGDEPTVNQYRDGRSAMAEARLIKASGAKVAVYQEVPVLRGGGKPKSAKPESAPSKSKPAAKKAKKPAAKKAGVAKAAAKRAKKITGTGEGVANPGGNPEASAGSSGDTE